MAIGFDLQEFVRLKLLLAKNGLEVLGSFRLPRTGDEVEKAGLMVISGGMAMWPIFTQAAEYCDGQDNPLDRWSERVLSIVAREFEAELYLPSQTPFHPFQRWAAQAGGLGRSPLGILIDKKYGPWLGLRGALIFPLNVSIQLLETLIQEDEETRGSSEKICTDCVEKPCLTHCPVNAFSNGGLVVGACYSHLDKGVMPDCMSEGCAARGVCPIGLRHQYEREQLQFHMKSYRG